MSHLNNPLVMESKTLWIGDIEHWMDESYIGGLFAGTGNNLFVKKYYYLGAVTSVKLIRDKNTGLPAGKFLLIFLNKS